MPLWQPEDLNNDKFIIDENYYDMNDCCPDEMSSAAAAMAIDEVCQAVEIPDGEPPEEDVDLLSYLLKLVPGWKRQKQQRGTCVGQGFKLAIDTLMAVNNIMSGLVFPGRAAVCTIYGGSRVDVAGKPGRWDGSYGWAAIKWLHQFGVVTLEAMGLEEDALWDDESIAVSYAGRREGVPKEFEDVAKETPIKQYHNLTSSREAAWLLRMGHPVVQCSNLIPSGNVDSDGVSRPRRSGGHCTAVLATRYRNGKRQFAYDNSWGGNWGIEGRVWILDSDLDDMISRGDSYVPIGMHGVDHSLSA